MTDYCEANWRFERFTDEIINEAVLKKALARLLVEPHLYGRLAHAPLIPYFAYSRESPATPRSLLLSSVLDRNYG